MVNIINISLLKELTINCSNIINPLTKRKFIKIIINVKSATQVVRPNASSDTLLTGETSLTSEVNLSEFLTVFTSLFNIKKTHVTKYKRLVIKVGSWMFR